MERARCRRGHSHGTGGRAPWRAIGAQAAAPARCLCGRKASRAAERTRARMGCGAAPARFISILQLPWFRMFGDSQ